MLDAFQKFQSEDTEADVLVGTPTNPLEISPFAPAPTGSNAQRSLADRWRRFLAGDKKDKDAFFPVEARRTRRAQARQRATEQRKHQKGYYRRELAKEKAARDLLNLFQIADGAVESNPIMRHRAEQRILARIKYLRDEQQKAYDTAIEARQKDRSLPAPSPIASHEEIRAQLWKIAQTATLPAAKLKVA